MAKRRKRKKKVTDTPSNYGLSEGCKIVEFDEYALEFELLGIGRSATRWIKPDGKVQKTVPAFVKKDPDLAKKLADTKEEFKTIKTELTAQRNRIERFYLHKTQFDYAFFKKQYIEHGLLIFLCEKLIWTFAEGEKTAASAIHVNDIWQTADGTEFHPNDAMEVRLWHPIECEIEQVMAWRNRLETLDIQQPIKQAYREVYLLTDAEVNTRVYSNRMAAHILKQAQFAALTRARAWKYRMLNNFGEVDCEIAHISLPEYELTAEYWINSLYDEEEEDDWDFTLLDYVVTDQVKFLTAGDKTLDMVDVPKIIFSEIMRDVDLFVGVASVGNDPNWQDNGGLPQYREYWESYSFGDLTQVAKTRKEALTRLLPRLKIKDIARIDGRFLRIKGKIREYKIHIGSTNILMEPNDQYLCIVPDRSKNTKGDKLFLPFEGDRGLSLVLSKAFLLADDDKITDETIISQLRT